MELRTAISARLSIPLPATATFDYPSPDALTDFVITRLQQQQPAAMVVHPAASLPTASVHVGGRREAEAGTAVVGLACSFPGAEGTGEH